MSLQIAGSVSNALAALFAFAAAVLWYISAKIRVPLASGDTGNPEMIVDGFAFVATAKAQTVWSRRAAFAAALAAMFQALGLALGVA